MSDIESVKAMCRAVLMCSSHGILANKFAKEYEETSGSTLPLKGLGIRNVLDLPRLIPDVIKAERNAQGQIVFYVIVDSKTAHIAKMKSKEKTKSKKNRRTAGTKKMFFAGSTGSAPPRNFGPALSRPASSSRPASRPAARPAVKGSRSTIGSGDVRGHNSSSSRATAPRFQSNHLGTVNRAMSRESEPKTNGAVLRSNTVQTTPQFNNNSRITSNNMQTNSDAAKRTFDRVPAGVLVDKIKNMMSNYTRGLWSGHLVQTYEDYYKETAEPNLLQLVLQMEGVAVRVERPYGQNSNKVILMGIEEEDPEEEDTPPPPPAHAKEPLQTNGSSPPKTVAKVSRYPFTYRYIHSPLPWLGIRVGCWVTLAHSPSYFWVQMKSPHLDDLVKITDMIQTNCERAPVEVQGNFYVEELVCALYTDDVWYRAIVLDVGHRTYSCMDSLDPAMFLPGKPTPQFKWQDTWQVKVFFIDYGNIEWLPLNKVKRKKFPYPPGQAFRCSLGSIKAVDEWTPAIMQTFQSITENKDTLEMTVEAVKNEKAHYGFKSRLNEYCQKHKLEMAVFEKPLNSDYGWKTSCKIRHPTKGLKEYTGFYQNKKNDAEASAAQHVIRDWEIQLLTSREIPGHWIEVQLEDTSSGEHFNKSLVESQVATAKASIYDMEIPKQPKPHEIPTFKSEMVTTLQVDSTDSDDGASGSEQESFYSAGDASTASLTQEPEPMSLPEKGDLIYMQVTHVKGPHNICLRIIEGAHKNLLHKEEDKLTEYMTKNAKLITDVKINMLCVVYSESGSSEIAYRGRVLRLLKRNKAEILMLDYGDTTIYDLSELYHLPPSHNTLPYQAISGCLYGMDNIISEDSMTKYMKEELNMEDSDCMVKIKDIIDGRILSVELYYDNDTNINKEILARDAQNLRPDLPLDDEEHPVLLTNISNEGVLSLQIPGPGIRTLAQLMLDLSNYYEGRTVKASEYIVSPENGQICCTTYNKDGVKTWYRALVEKVVDANQVLVQYVDYGNTEVIPKSRLREPNRSDMPNIFKLPFQAYYVQLDGLPTNATAWTTREIETFKGYVSDQSILAKVVDKSGEYPLVKIYLENNNHEPPKELNKLMEGDMNLFRSAPDTLPPEMTLNFSNMSLANPIMVPDEDIVLDMQKMPKLTIKKEDEAIITHVDHPESWFFQSRDAFENFKQFAEDLNLFYSNPVEMRNPVYAVHQLCVTYVPQYQGWYRAKVLNKSTDSKLFQCSMVDYGDVQTIPASNVRPLVKRFAQLPIQACRAALTGVVPKDRSTVWDEAAKQYFTATISDKVVWVRFVSQDQPTHLLRMHIIDTSGTEDIYVAQDMVNRGYALPIQKPE